MDILISNVQSIERIWLGKLHEISVQLFNHLNNKSNVTANEGFLHVMTTPIYLLIMILLLMKTPYCLHCYMLV